MIDVIQTMNHTKLSFCILISSLILKIILNIPSMNLCYLLGIDVYYGPIVVTLIVQFISIIVILFRYYKNNSCSNYYHIHRRWMNSYKSCWISHP